MVKIGALVSYRENPADMDAEFARLEKLGLNACQLCLWPESDFSQEKADETVASAKRHGVEITALWAGWSGPKTWNFYEGQKTLGIVPPEYREMRVKEILARAEFAKKMGITDVITHCGYLPENPYDPNYEGVVAAVREIGEKLKENGQWFLFETGQETPVTMLRVIEEAGTGNLGVNLDTANLILYGKANTLDSLDVFGSYVRNTHLKDGFYPTSGRELGKECPLGEGKANITAVVKKLKELGYQGPYIIEREISGDQQTKDIAMAKELVLSALGE